jgi:hypothetical protein
MIAGVRSGILIGSSRIRSWIADHSMESFDAFETINFRRVAWEFYSGLGCLIVQVSRLHPITPHSLWLLWTRDLLVADNSTWQHTTFTADRDPCPQRDSNPQFQQASGQKPTPKTAPPLGLAKRFVIRCYGDHNLKICAELNMWMRNLCY